MGVSLWYALLIANLSGKIGRRKAVQCIVYLDLAAISCIVRQFESFAFEVSECSY